MQQAPGSVKRSLAAEIKRKLLQHSMKHGNLLEY
jgi:hypothetical protein